MDVMILGVIGVSSTPVKTFTAYDCSDRSNIAESYSLLKPDSCVASHGNGEVEKVVFGEIAQMIQYHIILIFRCQVVKTIVSRCWRHWSSVG
jgi:hypothetical protein